MQRITHRAHGTITHLVDGAKYRQMAGDYKQRDYKGIRGAMLFFGLSGLLRWNHGEGGPKGKSQNFTNSAIKLLVF